MRNLLPQFFSQVVAFFSHLVLLIDHFKNFLINRFLAIRLKLSLFEFGGCKIGDKDGAYEK